MSDLPTLADIRARVMISKSDSDSDNDGPVERNSSGTHSAEAAVPRVNLSGPLPSNSMEDPLIQADCRKFKVRFGDGFSFTPLIDRCEVSGLLPYTIKGAEYFTPVVIIIFGSAFMRACAANQAQLSSLPRYRCRVDLQAAAASGLIISKRAAYLDPLSGAVIPAAQDAAYTDVVTFAEKVVIRNFEIYAPLCSGDRLDYGFLPTRPLSVLDNQYQHMVNAKGSLVNVLSGRSAETVRRFRLYEDLSRFGDGLFRLRAEEHAAVGMVPVWAEKATQKLCTGHGECVQTDILDAKIVLAVRVRVQFTPDATTGAYAATPEVLLLDALQTVETQQCFSRLLVGGTNMVRADLLEPLAEWTRRGSLYDILCALQHKLTEAVTAFAAAAAKSANTSNATSTLNSTAHGNTAEANELDKLFGTPSNGSPYGSPTSSNAGGAGSSGSRCVLCLRHEKSTVLKPCGHLAMCTTCAQQLAANNLINPGAIHCPVCHQVSTDALAMFV